MVFDDDCPCDHCTRSRAHEAEETRLHHLIAELHASLRFVTEEREQLRADVRSLRGGIERACAEREGALEMLFKERDGHDALKVEHEQLRAVGEEQATRNDALNAHLADVAHHRDELQDRLRLQVRVIDRERGEREHLRDEIEALRVARAECVGLRSALLGIGARIETTLTLEGRGLVVRVEFPHDPHRD